MGDVPNSVEKYVDQVSATYASRLAELDKRELANSQALDDAILKYSFAGLALSVGFLKDFVPIAEATSAWLLYSSWAFFVASIIATLASFVTSQHAIDAQHRIIEAYYQSLLERFNLLAVATLGDTQPPKHPEVQNGWGAATRYLTYAAATTFVLALLGSTCFVITNLQKEQLMSTKRVIAQDGAPTVRIHKVLTTPVTQKQTQPVAGTPATPAKTILPTGQRKK